MIFLKGFIMWLFKLTFLSLTFAVRIFFFLSFLSYWGRECLHSTVSCVCLYWGIRSSFGEQLNIVWHVLSNRFVIHALDEKKLSFRSSQYFDKYCLFFEGALIWLTRQWMQQAPIKWKLFSFNREHLFLEEKAVCLSGCVSYRMLHRRATAMIHILNRSILCCIRRVLHRIRSEGSLEMRGYCDLQKDRPRHKQIELSE